MDIWSKPAGLSGPDAATYGGLDYWQYFGLRFVEHAAIAPAAQVLDVGCGDGSSLFPAGERTGARGRAVGIDICPH